MLLLDPALRLLYVIQVCYFENGQTTGCFHRHVLICCITPVTQSTHKPSLIGVLGQVYGYKDC